MWERFCARRGGWAGWEEGAFSPPALRIGVGWWVGWEGEGHIRPLPPGWENSPLPEMGASAPELVVQHYPKCGTRHRSSWCSPFFDVGQLSRHSWCRTGLSLIRFRWTTYIRRRALGLTLPGCVGWVRRVPGTRPPTDAVASSNSEQILSNCKLASWRSLSNCKLSMNSFSQACFWRINQGFTTSPDFLIFRVVCFCCASGFSPSPLIRHPNLYNGSRSQWGGPRPKKRIF